MPEDELASETIQASSRTAFPPLPIGFPDDLYKESEHFLIPCEARPYHMYVVGTTGAGKSSLARNMIASDIAWGMGVSVVDPHGDLVRALLENHIPKSRTNDVIYIEPTNPTRTIGLNILEGVIPEHRPLVVSQIVSIFYKLYKESWGPRLEDILGNSLYALLEQPRPVSLAAIPKLLTNAEYRAEVLQHVHNPIVRDFFVSNYDAWKDAFREEAISAVLNKMRAFLRNPLLLSIIGQTRSSFNFRQAMDERRIILVDLSKGTFGEGEATLLGGLIVAMEKLAALSRANISEDARVPHALYVDEAQNFITDYESILAEARKYRLSLVLLMQGIAQLKDTAAAIFTNTATKVSFRVSPEDAERLKKAFTMNRDESELQDLPNYSVYVHTLKTHPTTGVTRPSGPHLVNVFPPFDKTADDNAGERVLRASNRAYTRPRAEVMEAINRFLAPKPKPEKPVKKPRRNLTMEAVGRVEAKLNRIAPEPLPALLFLRQRRRARLLSSRQRKCEKIQGQPTSGVSGAADLPPSIGPALRACCEGF